MPSISKRAKTEEGSTGSLPTPPDPTYAAMAMYYSKLNAFRPWSPKGGFPPGPLPGYPLQSPFGRSDLEVRRPEEINQASLERFRSESESPHSLGKKKFDKGIVLYSILIQLNSKQTQYKAFLNIFLIQTSLKMTNFIPLQKRVGSHH